MSRIEFKIYGLPDKRRGERRSQDNETRPNRGALWLVAGILLAYLLAPAAQSRGRVSIISPTSGTSTFDTQVAVSGTVINSNALSVTLRVDGTSLTAPVTNGIFTAQVPLTAGRHEIRALADDLQSDPIAITIKQRPVVRISSPPTRSVVQNSEIQVVGTVEHLEGDSIDFELNGGTPQKVPAADGQFSTTVSLEVGPNIIRALVSGSDPAEVIVVRGQSPSIVIISPDTKTTAESQSINVTGNVFNSEAREIKLQRNDSSKIVALTAGKFASQVSLAVGENTITAFVGDVRSADVIVYLPRIVIETKPQLSNPTPAMTRSVMLFGSVEFSDAQTVTVSVNGVATPVSVRAHHFEYTLPLKPGGRYSVRASLGEVSSNEVDIDVLPYVDTTPSGGGPVTPQQCKQIIVCDCDYFLAQDSSAPPTKRTFSGLTPGALRERCLAQERKLQAECLTSQSWPTRACPPETSGPKAWRPLPDMKSRFVKKPEKGVKP